MTDLLSALAGRAIAPARARPDVTPRPVAKEPGPRPAAVMGPRTTHLDESLEKQVWTDAPELADDAVAARREASTPSRRTGVARSRRSEAPAGLPSAETRARAVTAEPSAATEADAAGRRPADMQAPAAEREPAPAPEIPASRSTQVDTDRAEAGPRAPLADPAPAPAMPVDRPPVPARTDVAIIPAVSAAIEVATQRAALVDPRAADRADDGTPDAPRTVHVSIGRVEVHATAQQAPVPARPVPQLAVPRTSLDDYLRARDGAGR